jgi:hypothetical protein
MVGPDSNRTYHARGRKIELRTASSAIFAFNTLNGTASPSCRAATSTPISKFGPNAQIFGATQQEPAAVSTRPIADLWSIFQKAYLQ